MLNNNIIIGISIIVGIFALFIYLVFSYEKKRSKALNAEANKLGLQFEKNASDKSFNKYESFYLASMGQNDGLTNRMWGELNGLNIAIFEHKYTIPSGEGSSAIKHTVVSLETTGGKIPSFTFIPKHKENLVETMGGMIESFLGKNTGEIDNYKEIPLDSNPTFLENHQLKGKDEAAIQEIFNSGVLDFMEQDPELYVENQGDIFLCYYKSVRYKANEIIQLTDKAETIRKLLSLAKELNF